MTPARSWRQVAPAPAPPAAPAPGAAAGRGAAPAAPQGGGRGGFDGGNPGYYYAQVRVNPTDKEHVYVLSVGWSRSRDGGRTWQGMGFGGDHHAMWIDPNDPEHFVHGDDGGVAVTEDGGKTNRFVSNLPLAQFYHVAFDMDTPYNVYGGLQDNGAWRGPSSERGGGQSRSRTGRRWAAATASTTTWTAPAASSSTRGSSAAISRTDLYTGESRGITNPRPVAALQLEARRSSPPSTTANVVYQAANRLMKSTMLATVEFC